MIELATAQEMVPTIADLLEQLAVPATRVYAVPAPGTATENDVLAMRATEPRRLCEVIEGVLVEKVMGARESQLACLLIGLMLTYLQEEDRGIVLGEGGMLRLWPGRVRIPDVCFIAWSRLPQNELPNDPIPNVVPDLVIEILSRGNTREEMLHKRHDYFQSGVREVWEIQPRSQTAAIYNAPTRPRRLSKDQALEGGTILPGFRVPLRELFARLKKKP